MNKSAPTSYVARGARHRKSTAREKLKTGVKQGGPVRRRHRRRSSAKKNPAAATRRFAVDVDPHRRRCDLPPPRDLSRRDTLDYERTMTFPRTNSSLSIDPFSFDSG